MLELRARLERHIDALPVLPTVVARLMTLDREDANHFEDVLGLVEADPSFAARILSAANSASSAPTDPVASVRSALVRLGSQGASAAIIAAAVAQVFIPRDDWEKSLWRHAVQVGEAARALADLDPSGLVERDVAYTAGLLHDVGRLVMFQEAPEALREIDEGDWDSPETLVEAERAMVGVTHSELGARACRRWLLPDVLVRAVARHHETPRPVREPADQLLALVRTADLAMFPSAMPGTPGFDEADDEAYRERLLPRLPASLTGVTVGELRAVVTDVTRRADATVQSLGLG